MLERLTCMCGNNKFNVTRDEKIAFCERCRRFYNEDGEEIEGYRGKFLVPVKKDVI